MCAKTCAGGRLVSFEAGFQNKENVLVDLCQSLALVIDSRSIGIEAVGLPVSGAQTNRPQIADRTTYLSLRRNYMFRFLSSDTT